MSVRGLAVGFRSASGAVPAVRGVDLSVAPGETVALVGESGSGKSASVLGILGLLPSASVEVSVDHLEFEGVDYTAAGSLERELGQRVGVIFQDPQSSLNPTMKVGRQVGEILRLQGATRRVAAAAAIEALRDVGIPDPVWCAGAYPHQLSGGMRQRVMIALATIGAPSLLIADEPTTALDTTLQQQVTELLLEKQQENNSGLLFITHDLALVSQFAQRIVVMYAGQIVETGTTAEVVQDALHPYAAALLASVPTLGGAKPTPIGGRPPDPRQLPAGCSFSSRCHRAMDRCSVAPGPPSFVLDEGRRARCWLVEGVGDDVSSS